MSDPNPQTRATAGIVGGKKSRRAAGSMEKTGKKPPRIIPPEASRTRGYTFPTENATPKQDAALQKIMVDFIRMETIQRHGEHFTAETIGKALGLAERQSKTRVSEALKSPLNARLKLVFDVLHGMCVGTIAGVLGTRKTQDNKWLFSEINHIYIHDDAMIDLDEYEGDWFDDKDALRLLHAAFQRDYRLWLGRK